MIAFILKKLGYALFTLFGVITIVFFLFNVLPADPAKMMLGKNYNKEQLQAVRAKYGFDQPVWKQYVLYLNDLSPISLHSTDPDDYTFLGEEKYQAVPLINFGEFKLALKWPYLRESFQQNGRKVSDIIGETLPNTMILAVSAIIIALILGIFLGSLSAIYKDSWIDKSVQILSTTGISIPSFFSAILFAWLFGFVLHEYTHLEMTGNLYELDDFGESYELHLENIILPAVVLGIRPLGLVVQLMRNSLLEVLQQDYIRTARAKGLSTAKVLRKHALKNAMSPVVTTISGWFASLMAGAVFVEYIFGWNGLGKEVVEALKKLDLPVIMGAVLTIAVIFIIINIFVDIIYGWLDPRVTDK